MIIIPNCKINPSGIVLYNTYVNENGFVKTRRGNHLPNTGKHHNNIVSAQAAKKIKTAVDYMLLASNQKKKALNFNGRDYDFKIAFVTLTLPSMQIHSDNVIKAQCLNQFLIEIRKRFHTSNYIWRAEKQLNGNIHFHILFSKFIPHDQLRKIWNRIINKLGYVDRYAKKMKEWHSAGFRVRPELLQTWHEKLQYNAYLRGKKENWLNPNSTDVHCIRNLVNIKAYLHKYLSKNEQCKDQIGRLWGCSESLSKARGAVCEIDSNISDDLSKIVANNPGCQYIHDHFICITVSLSTLAILGCNALLLVFLQFFESHFNHKLLLDITS